MSVEDFLSEDDRQFLTDQRNSLHFKVYTRALNQLLAAKTSELIKATPDTLLRHQGVLQGLNLAKAILFLGTDPEKK